AFRRSETLAGRMAIDAKLTDAIPPRNNNHGDGIVGRWEPVYAPTAADTRSPAHQTPYRQVPSSSMNVSLLRRVTDPGVLCTLEAPPFPVVEKLVCQLLAPSGSPQ